MASSQRDAKLRITAVLALFVLLVGMHLATPTATLHAIADALELLLCLGAAGLCLRAAAASRGLARAFWTMFGLASALWAGGVAVSLISRVPVASFSGRMAPGDFFFMASSSAFVAACALRPDRPRGGWRVAFDVIILAVLLLHTWLYFAVPDSLAGAKLSVARLLLGRDARATLMLASAIWLVQGSRGAWRRIYIQQAAAIVVLFAGGALVFRGVLAGSYHPGLWTLPWTASFLLIGLAARDGDSQAHAAGEPPAFSPDWGELRHETAVAFIAIVFVPALGFVTALLLADAGLEGAELHTRVAQVRIALSLGTTVLVASLLLARQIHLLRWAERVHEERQHALQQSEERFSKAFSASPAAMSISTFEDGRYLDVNERYLRLTGGKKREEVVGRTSLEVGFFQGLEDRERLLGELREGRSVSAAPLVFTRGSGERRDVLVSLEPIELGATRCLLGVVEDVTHRLRADQALRASERRYRLLFERNLAGVFRMTASGRILECNDSLVQMLGYGSREQLLARPASELYPGADDRDRELRLLMEKGSLSGYEVCLRREDGAPVWVMENEMLVPPDEGEGEEAVIEGTVVDITARKHAEEETRRLAQLKTNFLIVVSHEMRTPLTILAGYHELLVAEDGRLTAEQKHSLEICQRTLQRLDRAFNDILATLQIAEGRLRLRPTTVDLRAVACQVVEELAPFIERRRLETRIEGPDLLPPLSADPERIHEAVSNLVENAIKFTPDEGEITVRLGVEPGWLRITVEDTGIGIEAQEIEDIWERFYAGADPQHHRSGTYEFKTRGSGLGLVIAKGCVEAHGGRIFATSAGTDRGAAFTILLRFDPSGARVATG